MNAAVIRASEGIYANFWALFDSSIEDIKQLNDNWKAWKYTVQNARVETWYCPILNIYARSK